MQIAKMLMTLPYDYRPIVVFAWRAWLWLLIERAAPKGSRNLAEFRAVRKEDAWVA